ncbi:MAG: hypothetical protein ACKO5P_11090, partial [Nodosilinea sp.]
MTIYQHSQSLEQDQKTSYILSYPTAQWRIYGDQIWLWRFSTKLRGWLKRIIPGIVRRQGVAKILHFAVIIL